MLRKGLTFGRFGGEGCRLLSVVRPPVAKRLLSSERSRGTDHSPSSRTKNMGVSLAAVLVFSTVLVAKGDPEANHSIAGDAGSQAV